jgi:hypothetical protein
LSCAAWKFTFISTALSSVAASSGLAIKTAKALGIEIPAPLLGRAAACSFSLDGLRAQPHDTVSAFTGRVN